MYVGGYRSQLLSKPIFTAGVHASKFTEYKILRQRHQVRIVPVSKVNFDWKGRKSMYQVSLYVVDLSVCVFVYLSTIYYLYIYLSIYLSIYPGVRVREQGVPAAWLLPSGLLLGLLHIVIC